MQIEIIELGSSHAPRSVSARNQSNGTPRIALNGKTLDDSRIISQIISTTIGGRRIEWLIFIGLNFQRALSSTLALADASVELTNRNSWVAVQRNRLGRLAPYFTSNPVVRFHNCHFVNEQHQGGTTRAFASLFPEGAISI